MGIIMRNGKKYSGASSSMAENIVYDNTESGLEANDVQGAIDELSSNVDEQNKNLNNGIRFVDYANPFKTFNTNGETWVATQDCCIAGLIGNLIKNAAVLEIDGVQVAACAVANGAASSTTGINVYVKKGQTVSMRTSASYQISAYPLIN